MLTVQESLAIVTREARPLVATSLALSRAAGALLAEPLYMDIDSPPFDRAMVDGFALLSADARAGASLRIVGRQDAGGPLFPGPLLPGQALGINTGAPLPAGADAVVMVEHTRVEGATVMLQRPLAAGQGMQKRGADARAGQRILEACQTLHAAQMALAAMAGAAQVAVRRARVAILTTGDELVPIAATPGPGQIRNSNGPMMAELVRHTGAEVLDLGVVGDREADLRAMLERGLAEADLLLVSGGMSMGTRDLVPPLLTELGVAIHIAKLRIKPGKPFIFGTRDGASGRKYVAGLPGNPVSAFVTFHRFVRAILGALTGERDVDRSSAGCTTVALEANGDRAFYRPCAVAVDAATARVQLTPLAWKGSADLFTLGQAQGLLIREPGAPAVEAGAVVPVLLL